MPRNSPLTGYGAGIRKETLLGWVAWYGISDPEVKYDDLKQKVTDLGLDVDALPAPLRAGDSFKRACRYAEQKKLPYGDLFINIMIRSVSQDQETIERHVVVEIVDANDKRLEYEVAAHLILDKFIYYLDWQEGPGGKRHQRSFRRREDGVDARTNVELDKRYDEKTWNLRLTSALEDAALHVERSDWAKKPKNRQLVSDALERFEDEYERATTYLDAQTLRQMMRRQLDNMDAFLLRRNGSVYFVKKAEEERAVALCDLLEWIGHGSGFHILPLIDTEKQREMIQGAFEDEVHESAQAMLNTLSEALQQKRPVTKTAWVDFMNRKEALQARATEYSDLIDREFIKAGTELALLDDTMTEILQAGLIKAGRSQ
jgi:hypothetical protein